jgi:hypothetical protein
LPAAAPLTEIIPEYFLLKSTQTPTCQDTLRLPSIFPAMVYISQVVEKLDGPMVALSLNALKHV